MLACTAPRTPFRSSQCLASAWQRSATSTTATIAPANNLSREGHAAAGQPGIVRQEDLPKQLRVITPSSGIVGFRSISPEIASAFCLAENLNTIVEAFWE